MIRKKTIIKKAFCDICGKSLSSEDQKNPDGTSHDVHYGKFTSSFGYGSRLDMIEDAYDVCEDCYEHALRALGVPIFPDIVTTPLYMASEGRFLESGKPPPKDSRKEVYTTPVWRCYFCDFVSEGKGVRLPIAPNGHRCRNWAMAQRAAVGGCKLCASDGDLRKWPYIGYVDDQRMWVHVNPGDPHKQSVACTASHAITKFMRTGF